MVGVSGPARLVAGGHRGVGDTAEHKVLAGIIIVVEIRVCVIDAVVEDADRHPCAGIVIPDGRNIGLDPGRSATLTRVVEMPLRRSQAVRRHVECLNAIGMSICFVE